MNETFQQRFEPEVGEHELLCSICLCAYCYSMVNKI